MNIEIELAHQLESNARLETRVRAAEAVIARVRNLRSNVDQHINEPGTLSISREALYIALCVCLEDAPPPAPREPTHEQDSGAHPDSQGAQSDPSESDCPGAPPVTAPPAPSALEALADWMQYQAATYWQNPQVYDVYSECCGKLRAFIAAQPKPSDAVSRVVGELQLQLNAEILARTQAEGQIQVEKRALESARLCITELNLDVNREQLRVKNLEQRITAAPAADSADPEHDALLKECAETAGLTDEELASITHSELKEEYLELRGYVRAAAKADSPELAALKGAARAMGPRDLQRRAALGLGTALVIAAENWARADERGKGQSNG